MSILSSTEFAKLSMRVREVIPDELIAKESQNDVLLSLLDCLQMP